ncbi:MAG: hypothetical protein ABF271_02590 [Abyssibacter sp.]|uniref:hypothetical protein n=1 Tax=Abyssibacter sp. TaxID=2320200 RepID=UPI0032194BD8
MIDSSFRTLLAIACGLILSACSEQDADTGEPARVVVTVVDTSINLYHDFSTPTAASTRVWRHRV